MTQLYNKIPLLILSIFKYNIFPPTIFPLLKNNQEDTFNPILSQSKKSRPLLPIYIIIHST